ncbi:MAG: MAPEG family protein [Pseudomonadota bacterium]|nr:MAPEG family protein [Pseudomonadota bacterium]
MVDLTQYHLTLLALGLTAMLMIVQLLIADVLAIVKKHPPGFPVENNHANLLFRANRTHLNSNESIAIFILSIAFAIAMNANSNMVNGAALSYFVARALYAICYYLNLKLLRSALFVISLVALIVINIAGFIAWF